MNTYWKSLGGVLGLVLLLGGCAETHQVKDQNIQTGFLTNSYPLLSPGGEGQASLRYIKSGTNWKKYNKISLDAVQVWIGKESSSVHDAGVIPQEDVRRLANTFYAKLKTELEKDYTIVPSAGPDVMRLSVALTDIEHGMPVLDTVSTVVPVARLLSEGKKLVSGTHAFVGHANVEARLADSRSGEVLAAGVDHRAGAKILGKGAWYWRDVENVFDYWAKTIRYRLCLKREGKNCEAPNA